MKVIKKQFHFQWDPDDKFVIYRKLFSKSSYPNIGQSGKFMFLESTKYIMRLL